MKILFKGLLVLFAFIFSFGCATKQMQEITPEFPAFEARQFNSDNYKAKVDNFLILFDGSSSMSEFGKFATAKELVSRMNETIPEMGQTAGLRSFGHSQNVSKESTVLFYGMENYISFNLEQGLEKISEAGGSSPLYKALSAAEDDLSGLSGNIAVIIITDGLDDMPSGTLAAAERLKDLYGSSICFYPILVGDSPEGESLLKNIARNGGCGFYSTVDQLMTSEGMADFVEKVFLDKEEVAPVFVPEKPKVVVPVEPVRKDSDNDGVYDDEDQCPGTPMGAAVNQIGCWVLDNVLFDFNKAVIKPMAYPLLDNVAEILERNPGMGVELHGHCDGRGTAEYNQELSIKRADAVKDYLTGKGIMENRLTTKGFGFDKPIASNSTDAGRASNRRVEIHPY